MDNIVMHLASYAVGALWQVPLLAAAGWLVARLVRRLGPAAEHNAWELTLLLCVLIPALPAPRSTGHSVQVNIAEAGNATRTAVVVHDGVFLQNGPLWLPREVLAALCAAWLLVLLWSAARLVRSFVETRRIVRNATPLVLPPDRAVVVQQCMVVFDLRDVRVLAAEGINGPATVTIDGDALLLPSGMVESVSLKDFQAAVAHECAHVQRRDFRKHLLYRALALPIAFHPVTRLVLRQLAATREMACDDLAATALQDAHAYRTALLRLATWMVTVKRPTLAVGMFDMNTLEARMERMTTHTSVLARPLRYAAVAIAAICMCATSFGAAVAAVALAPATPAEPRVYSIGKDVTPPHLISQVDPQFPADARERNGLFNGECVVALTVDESGMPQDVHITRSLGKGFDENAVAAVKQYRFKPALHNGEPVAVAISVSVNYQRF